MRESEKAEAEPRRVSWESLFHPILPAELTLEPRPCDRQITALRARTPMAVRVAFGLERKRDGATTRTSKVSGSSGGD